MGSRTVTSFLASLAGDALGELFAVLGNVSEVDPAVIANCTAVLGGRKKWIAGHRYVLVGLRIVDANGEDVLAAPYHFPCRPSVRVSWMTPVGPRMAFVALPLEMARAESPLDPL
jgi:hypothetical protein